MHADAPRSPVEGSASKHGRARCRVAARADEDQLLRRSTSDVLDQSLLRSVWRLHFSAIAAVGGREGGRTSFSWSLSCAAISDRPCFDSDDQFW
jgi:hypothetical protein